MESSLLFFGFLVVFSYCEGNTIGRSSNGVAYNGGGASSGYPVDTGPIRPCAFAGSESQSSSSGFSGNVGAGDSFSGSQSQSGAGSFVNNNVGHLGSESGSSVVDGEHRILESQGQSFGQALGNAIIETASNVQSAVSSGISQLGSNVQNIANTVANTISSNLETLHAASAATAANIQNNVQNIANTVANGIASNLESLNAVQAASAATAANIQNNVQNLANSVAGGISSNLQTLNAVHGSLQAAESSSAESGVGQVAIDRLGQHPYDTVGSQIGNIDHTNVASGNGGEFSSFSSGGASGTFHVNTVSSVTQNGQTVIKHEEILDRLGERPQATSGTVVLDNNGQVIASEVHPSGPGNFAPGPEIPPSVNPGYAPGTFVPQSPNQVFPQGSFQTNSVSTSTQNGQTVITQERVTDRFGEQPHSSSETVVLDSNGNVVASSRPTNLAANGIDSVSSANSGFAQGNSAFSADQTRPVVNGGEMPAQVSNYGGINEQPAVVLVPQSSGNNFFDNLSSSFGSGGVAGTFHSSSVSSSTNENGQTVVTHQETSDRFGEPQNSSSGTVVVNNGVVSGVTCVNNQCVTHGN